MKRRTFLATGAVSFSAVAGCLGGDSNGGSGGDSDGGELDLNATDVDRDGVAPEFDEVPDERNVDFSSFGTVEEGGVQVPLAPIDVTHYWYKRREARFADARSKEAYEKSHVYGAVSSPVSNGMNGSGGGSDPVSEWPKDDRIVCYCGCPHHLSSMRASTLIQNGYENVYVIDEGFWKWHDKGYPMAGSNVEGTPEKWVIRGETDAAYDGRDAWARHRPSGQMEATGIADGGTYELHIKFHEVGPDSIIEVETPGYAVEGKLKDLASGTIRG